MSVTLGGTLGQGGTVCDPFIDQDGITEYRNCRLDPGGQTSPSGYQSSSPHGNDPPPPAARPAQDTTTTSSFLTTSENEISTHITSSHKTLPVVTSTHSSPDAPASPSTSPSHPLPQSIQITGTSTVTVMIASESLNPPSTVIQTSTSIVESTQRRGAGLSAGATAGIIVAVLVLALLVAAGLWWRRRHHTAISHNPDFPSGSSISTPSGLPSVAMSDVPTAVGSKRAVNRSGVLAGNSLGSVASSPSLLVYSRQRWRSRRSHLPPLEDDDPFASTPARPQISASDLVGMSERSYLTPSPFTLSAQGLSATSSAGRARYRKGEAMPTLRPEITRSARTDSALPPRLDPRALPTLDGTSAGRSPSRAPTKTWFRESSARSATPADALLPHLGHEGSADTLCRGRTAVDGGVCLAGGPLDEAVDDTDDSETLPPPYQRY
ncbi:hypothetical protein C8Q74DRAFT_981648 [Fomes fomentarius]|nr:hypothetical protein C8Q74DRAFT_981648 [Fomes fomentarius]